MSDSNQQLVNSSADVTIVVGSIPEWVNVSRTKWDDHSVNVVDSLEEAISMSRTLKRQSSLAISEQRLIWAFDRSVHEMEVQLGQAMRAFPNRVLLRCSGCALKGESRLFALGFRRSLIEALDRQSPGDSPLNPDVSEAESVCNKDAIVTWYEYSLVDYKAQPEWLNSKFWAHPERFEFDIDADANACGEDE